VTTLSTGGIWLIPNAFGTNVSDVLLAPTLREAGGDRPDAGGVHPGGWVDERWA
jgi:hypothetical protein